MKRTVLLCVIAILSITALYFVRASLTPLFIGLSFSYILMPIVRVLEKKGVNRYYAISCVYLIVIVLIFAIFWIGLPYMLSGIISLQKTALDYLQSHKIPFEIPESLLGISSQFGDYMLRYIGNAAAALSATIGIAINVAVGLVLSFYMILDREKIKESLLSLLPSGWHRFVIRVGKRVDVILKKFLLGQLGVALVISALLFVGLTILGIKNALLISVFAGLLDIVPYFGPILGAVPAVITAAMESPNKAIWTAVLFIIVQQIEGAYVSPKILGNYIGLHPIITIMAVIIGGHYFGFAGMLLAVPVCGIIKSIAKEIINTLDEYDSRSAF